MFDNILTLYFCLLLTHFSYIAQLIAGALEKMDKFLSLETAWKSRYQEESDLDDMHVPESAELFVTLLLTMTG